MRNCFRWIYNFVFIKNYWIILFAVVLLSYGQILGMGVWKDDNAIFFKFDHINEKTGYFGTGILGSGPYKFSVTPYYPIYKIFGNESTIPYYVLILFFYFVSTVCVYFLFTKLYSIQLGKIAALLFAAGYVSSEGFFWLANSMLSHMAILFISIILIFYHLYYSRKKIFYYLLSVSFYWLCIFLVPLRAHYFIAIILAFEVFYFAFKKIPRSLFSSLIRSLPFIFIFNHYYLSGIDNRALSIKDYVTSIFGGEFYKTFSFFSALSNIIIPDNYIKALFTKELLIKKTLGINLPFFAIFLSIFLAVFLFNLLKRREKRLLITTASLLLFFLWYFISKNIFSFPLSLSQDRLFTVFLGGIVLYGLFIFYFVIGKKKRKLYLFLCAWLILSIAAYAAYQPTAFFTTTHRYLTNTFLAEVGILALLYSFLCREKNFWGRMGSVAIVVWGFSNLANSVFYQNSILRNRSIPVANFYIQLKEYLPQIKKGDVLYFDVAGDAQDHFSNAFSVSSMPETTAIAWRYGIDRYDFSRFTVYDEFLYHITQNNIDLSRVHTFFYSSDGLIDTTNQTRDCLSKESAFKPVKNTESIEFNSAVPVLINMQIKAILKDKPESLSPSPLLKDLNYSLDKKLKIFKYLKSRGKYYHSAKISSESEWKYREIRNIIDGEIETPWQGHRIWWHNNHHEELTIDLGEARDISTILWRNWIKSLSPVSYNFQISTDGKNWQKISKKNNESPKGDGQVVLETFNPTLARFLKMEIVKTSSGDSPAITEFEVVDSEYKDVNLPLALVIKDDTFSIIESENEWRLLKNEIKEFAKLVVSWSTDKGSKNTIFLRAIVDSEWHRYQFVVPAGGTKINKMSFDINIPAEIRLSGLMMKNLSIREIENRGLIKEFKEN